MNQLPQEAIEAIEEEFPVNKGLPIYMDYRDGAKIALTNPDIYSKAGLISLEEMAEFFKWLTENATHWLGKDLWEYNLDEKDYTTAQLFQIYQEQKEKK